MKEKNKLRKFSKDLQNEFSWERNTKIIWNCKIFGKKINYSTKIKSMRLCGDFLMVFVPRTITANAVIIFLTD